MKITALTSQQKSDNRVNVIVDGKYRFSLDVYQVIDLGIRVGKEYSETELVELETESQFGKLYGRALEYCMMRPHSGKEVRDYLYRKTLDVRTKTGGIRKGADKSVAERVFNRLVEKGHIDDEQFTRWWVENRSLKKGASRRKLGAELRVKGVDLQIIEKHLADSARTDDDELRKVIAKKSGRYGDPQKLMQYLARQGFSYDDIKTALQDADGS
jgi:regulatory protein